MVTLTTDDGVKLHYEETGSWGERDPRAAPPSIWGPAGRPPADP